MAGLFGRPVWAQRASELRIENIGGSQANFDKGNPVEIWFRW